MIDPDQQPAQGSHRVLPASTVPEGRPAGLSPVTMRRIRAVLNQTGHPGPGRPALHRMRSADPDPPRLRPPVVPRLPPDRNAMAYLQALADSGIATVTPHWPNWRSDPWDQTPHGSDIDTCGCTLIVIRPLKRPATNPPAAIAARLKGTTP
ncbi:hypothetical protein AB0I28_32835 [Phytomonospora sp. NPDC050363]|uniref:hypothetical protein n=1 Tax=Phytomonospora sp. NPDC050363 TaxID=3155642 RepID=UPI0033FC9C1E